MLRLKLARVSGFEIYKTSNIDVGAELLAELCFASKT